jgi:hypothetical protein
MDDPDDQGEPVVSRKASAHGTEVTYQESRWTKPLNDDDKRPSVKKYAEVS